MNEWEKVEDIFNQALMISSDRRSSFINEACGSNEHLKGDVFSLLSAESKSREMFSDPIFPVISQLLVEEDLISLSKKPELGQYQLKRLIGRGGMGTVFLAEDVRLERSVALKILPTALAKSIEGISRFQREALAASSISHHNVAHIYDFGCHENYYFLIMEYVEGKVLRELISQKQIDILNAVRIALQIAQALGAAHKVGIIHRDIKPENVVLTHDNVVKVLDFGLAKFSDTDKKNNKPTSLETIPGQIIGTTAYMSPEQIRAQKIDRRTDLWSLGVVLYEMLEGARPFEGRTNSDIQASILLDTPKPVSLNKDLPELDKILQKTLNKEVSARYQTADELIRDLQNVQRQAFDYVNQSDRAKNSLILFITSPNFLIAVLLVLVIYLILFQVFA